MAPGEREAAAEWLENFMRTATPGQQAELKRIEALAKGLTPVIRRIITENLQAFADLIVEQRKAITKLEQRVAELEDVVTRP
jgi:hypothetical protein